MRCVYCGGEVLVQPEGTMGICTSCMAENPLPGKGVSEKDYEKAAKALRESRFDRAIELYEKLLIENPKDASVCWGMALSEYGIEYVEDPASGEFLPTLHRLSSQKFSENLYAKKAVECSFSSLNRDFYISQCKLIDSIQSRSLAISGQETPVDIFICYKRSEEGERRTADSRMAADYYRELTHRGYQVFFAEETLKVGEEYEPRIFAALQSAKVMIAIATKKEYYEAVWVRNEWSRYADLIRQDRREKGSTDRLLISMYQHMTEKELPEILRKESSHVEMDTSSNRKAELLNLVSSHFERGGSENVSKIVRQVRKSQEVLGEIEADKFSETAEKTRLLATIRLINQEYAEARQLFLRAISQPGGEKDPENYLGLMMCRRQIPGKEALAKSTDVSIEWDEDFQKALECADGQQKSEILKILKNCQDNLQWETDGRHKKSELEKKLNQMLINLEKSYKSYGKPAFSEYQKAQETLEQYQKLVWQSREEPEAKKRKINWNLVIFLILGNAVPCIYMGFNRFVPLGLHVIENMLLIVYALTYLICLWRFMDDLKILDTGCLTMIIRLFLIGFVSSLMTGFIISPAALPAGLLILAGTAVYYYKKKLQNRAYLQKINEGKKWASEYIREVPALSERLLKEAEEILEETAGPYSRYYLEFDTFTGSWKEKAEKIIEKKVAELRESLDAYERGNF